MHTCAHTHTHTNSLTHSNRSYWGWDPRREAHTHTHTHALEQVILRERPEKNGLMLLVYEGLANYKSQASMRVRQKNLLIHENTHTHTHKQFILMHSPEKSLIATVSMRWPMLCRKNLQPHKIHHFRGPPYLFKYHHFRQWSHKNNKILQHARNQMVSLWIRCVCVCLCCVCVCI
jgi:hypothetical protein